MPTKKGRPHGRLYDWDEWFAKPRFVLKKGRHFGCGMASMSQQIRDRAGDRGLRVSIKEGWLTLSVTVTKPEPVDA